MRKQTKTITLIPVLIIGVLSVVRGQEPIGRQDQAISAYSKVRPYHHPKVQTRLTELREKYLKSGETAALRYAQELGLELEEGRVAIQIYALDNDSQNVDLKTLGELGAIDIYASRSLVEALVPLSSLAEIAESVRGVEFIRTVTRPIPQGVQCDGAQAQCEGVLATGADSYHDAGVRGAGVSVAVIDIGFSGLGAAIANQEFGSGQTGMVNEECTKNYATGVSGITAVDIPGGNEHGTRVAQIVHDMAPDATICIKLIDSVTTYENAVDQASTEGAHVIAQSLSFNGESYYDGTGIVSDAISRVADSVLSVQASGNVAIGHWRGMFSDSDGDFIHEFVEYLDESNSSLVPAKAGDFIIANLTWDDWTSSSIDYDIYLLKDENCQSDFPSFIEDVAPTAKARSEDLQNGSQPPFENFGYIVPAGGDGIYCLVIHKASPDSVNAEMTVFVRTGGLDDFVPEYNHRSSSLADPAVDEAALAVGAIPQSVWEIGPQASFSSQGPRNVSKFSSLSLTKPDISAPTDVSVFPAGATFGGTSAASPHVAGCAALIISESLAQDPPVALTPSEVRNRLETQAIDMTGAIGNEPGKDNVYGFGRLNCTFGGPVCQDDVFEEDDRCASARLIPSVGIDGTPESHEHCDEDWIQFVGLAGETYNIETGNLSATADTYLEIYDEGCEELLDEDDDSGAESRASLLSFTPTVSGIYPVRVRQSNELYGGDQDYELTLSCVANCSGTADLSVTLAALSNPVIVGDNITWSANVTNNGPAEATDVVLTSTLPANASFVETSHSGICSEEAGIVTCQLGTIANGASFPTIAIAATASEGGAGIGSVTVSGDQPDMFSSNNSEQSGITVLEPMRVFETKLLANDGSSGDFFGVSVAVDDDLVIVGSTRHSHGGVESGSAYIFRWNGDSWAQEAELLPTDRHDLQFFGSSVDITGEVAIVGAPSDNEKGGSAGAAYVFRRNGSVWSQEEKLIASNASQSDNFGASVAIDLDRIVVGAQFANVDASDNGSAYVFKHTGAEWIEEAILVASDGAGLDWFGKSVDINSQTVVVGAFSNDDSGPNSGSAYVYRRSESDWFEEAKLTASDADTDDRFGYSVAVDDGQIIVGAVGSFGNAGTDEQAAYIFLYDNNSWEEEVKLMPSDVGVGDHFGFRVAIEGGLVFVSSKSDDSLELDAGSAYTFSLIEGDWSQQMKLFSSDIQSGDEFGRTVALDGSWALASAMRDDHNGTDSGSAYVYNLAAAPTPLITLTFPSISSIYSLGAPLTIEWTSTNTDPSDSIVLSMKRDSVPPSVTEPDGVNWLRFTLNTPNDGSEAVTIPQGVTVASDWRFYARHVESGAFDGTDVTFEIETGPVVIFSDDFESGNTAAWSTTIQQ